VVVDDGVHELVADTHALLGPGAITNAGDRMPGTAEAGEALAVDVQGGRRGRATRSVALPRAANEGALRAPLGSVRQPVACGWLVSPAMRRGPQPERRRAAQIRSCSDAGTMWRSASPAYKTDNGRGYETGTTGAAL
jgi:hypothetical protein